MKCTPLGTYCQYLLVIVVLCGDGSQDQDRQTGNTAISQPADTENFREIMANS